MIRPADIRRHLCRTLLFAVAIFAATELRADIFSIWPFGSAKKATGDNISAESAEDVLAELLDARQFWSEKVTMNGQNMTMKISMSDQSLSRVRASVLKMFPSAQAAGNESSLLLRRPLDDGGSQRIFLLQLKGLNPLLQFTTALPRDMPKECPRPLWPADFPLFPGAANLQLMRFPNRGSLFGTYEVPAAEQPEVLDMLTAKIRAAGWAPATAEHADLFGGSGDVFMKEEPDAALLLLGVARDAASGSIQVSLYTRKLK